jgi:hypothetical protein
LDDRPVASNGLLAAQEHVQLVPFDIAFDEFQVRKVLVSQRVQPNDLHIERRVRAAPPRDLCVALPSPILCRERFMLPSVFDSATFITRRLRQSNRDFRRSILSRISGCGSKAITRPERPTARIIQKQ